MALPMFNRAPLHEDIRVSDRGSKRRAERQKEALRLKVSPKILAGVLERSAVIPKHAAIAATTLAKKAQKAKAPATPPKAKPVEKAVQSKQAVRDKEYGLAVLQKVTARQEIAALHTADIRSLYTPPPAEYTTKGYVHKHSKATTFTAQEKQAYAMARQFMNDHYHAAQDDALVTVTVTKAVHSGSRKNKTRDYLDRSASLQKTLERIATFECVTELIDDYDEYEYRYTYSSNNITIGGVKISLGTKRELVSVPKNGTTQRSKVLSLVQRSDQKKSRVLQSEAAVTQPIVEAVTELEDLPPWDVEDAVARGYGSLETEMDTVPAERTAYIKECQALGHNHIYHLPGGTNVANLINTFQVARDQYMKGMSNLPTGVPHYFLEKLIREYSSNDSAPTPTPPTPVAAAIPVGDDLDAELKACFAALAQEWREASETGHLHPATLTHLKDKYGLQYEDWTVTFTTRKNRSVMVKQYFDALKENAQRSKAHSKAARQELHKETLVRTKVHKYRQKFSKASLRKNFRMMQDLRISREYSETVDMAYLNHVLYEMECKFPSYNEADEQRYEDWLCKDVTNEFLQAHLQRMEVQNEYNDMFSVVNQQASYRALKPQGVLSKYALSTAEDNIHITSPPTGAAVVTSTPATDIVGQQHPDFLIVDDVIVPFRRGTRTKADVRVPLKTAMSVGSVVSWLNFGGYTMPATA